MPEAFPGRATPPAAVPCRVMPDVPDRAAAAARARIINMVEYRLEQLAALETAVSYLRSLSETQTSRLKARLTEYLEFREEVDAFLHENFAALCSRACFESELSACCSKDGIITFFADILINALYASPQEIEALVARLQIRHAGFKCVYLNKNGCLMRIQPIVCKMFLCERAEKAVFAQNPTLKGRWEALKEKKQKFTWPDRPVLFDYLEEIVIEAGLSSSLMYLHNSPGLLRVKQKAGI